MTVHTKWEILVQKLLKSVQLFKSYGLFGEPKVVDFLFFGKMLKKNDIFWTKIYYFHYLIGYHAFFYSNVSSLCFKKRYYTHL
jgi:hypothetical protein